MSYRVMKEVGWERMNNTGFAGYFVSDRNTLVPLTIVAVDGVDEAMSGEINPDRWW